MSPLEFCVSYPVSSSSGRGSDHLAACVPLPRPLAFLIGLKSFGTFVALQAGCSVFRSCFSRFASSIANVCISTYLSVYLSVSSEAFILEIP